MRKSKRQDYLDYLLETGQQDEYEAELAATRARRNGRRDRQETDDRIERERALESLLDDLDVD